MKTELLRVIASSNILGEGVLWDARDQFIWWTDIQASRLFCYDWSDESFDSVELPERLGSFALTENPNIIIGAFASGFAEFNIPTGEITWLDRPEQGYTNTRFNDGRTDCKGRFWAGTMIEGDEAFDADNHPTKGSLYCLQHGRAFHKLDCVAIPNSLCWSPDNKTLYFADSLKHKIWAFDFDAEHATLSNRRLFAQTAEGVFPDGSCVDSEGYLWNAEYGGGRVTRYSPDGVIDHQIELPVTNATCVAFGGPSLKHLLVTSARQDLDKQQLAQQSQAGDLLVYSTDVTGIAEHIADPQV